MKTPSFTIFFLSLWLPLFAGGCDRYDNSHLGQIERRLAGRYQLRSYLGEGQQGTVYLAETPHGQLVAVKFFHETESNLINTNDVENSLHISTVLDDIPNISKVLEKIGDDLLVLQLVDGLPFDERLEKDVDRAQADKWLEEFLTIVEAILEHNVLPFDIGVEQLMVDQDETLMVIDLAYFIDLNRYQPDEDEIEIFRDEFLITLGDKERKVTPQLTTYLTAADFFDTVNAILESQGRTPIDRKHKPDPSIIELDARSYDDLQTLKIYLKEYLQELRRQLYSGTSARPS